MRTLPLMAILPFVLILVVVVTVAVYNQITQPQTIVVRITDGPTVLSTQIVRLDGH